jgi:ABC-type polysaccharide/polyol phosphate export permease
MYFFFSRVNPEMQVFGINATYFEFAIIGLCLQMVVGTSLGTVSANIYNEILSGTWSSVLLHFNFFEYSFGTTLAGVLVSSISIFIAIGIAYLTVGFYLMITFQEIILIILLFLLIILAHMSISMLFAAFTIFYQKATNLISILYQLTKTFSGVVFPISLLTGFPLLVSKSLPLTYGLQSIHQLLFSPTMNMEFIYVNCLIIIGFIVFIGSIAYGLAYLSLKNVRKNGKVDWY